MKKITDFSGIILSLAVIVAFFLFNVFTPVAIDDFAFLYSFTDGSRISSTADIFESQNGYYFKNGGRLMAQVFTQLFLMFDDKMVFNVCNTIVYALFILLIHFHIKGGFVFSSWTFFVINAFLWLFVPAWGQDFLWLTGSCYYLWTAFMALLFLLPFRLRLCRDDFRFKKALLFLFFPLSVMAGLTNEVSGASVLFMLIVYFVINKINRKGPVLFEVLGSVGFLAGYLILILAPGNYVRLDSFDRKSTLFLVELFGRFIKITAFVLQHFSLVIGLCILLGWKLWRYQKKKISAGIFFYGIGFLAGSYSLVMSPALSGRSSLIAAVFLAVLFFDLLRLQEIELPPFLQNNKPFIVIILLAAFFFSSVLPASRNIMSVYLRMKRRTEYIYQKKNEGVLDITVKSPIPVHDKHVSIDGLDDIGTSNGAMVKYYGINSLSGSLYGEDW